MSFNGFEESDFTLFEIDGLEERMEALISQLRPKLETFGKDLAPALSAITGEEMFAHVAKHARRKTNPPNDSWVAFSSNKRGYKMMPHFQIGLWHSHVFVQWGLIYESIMKERYANKMLADLTKLKKTVPNHYIWYKDHTKPDGIKNKDISLEQLEEFAKRLVENKNGELMVGITIPKGEALEMNGENFYSTVLKTFKTLNKLHRL